MSTWNNIEGCIYVECDYLSGVLVDTNGEKLPKSVDCELKREFTAEDLDDSFEIAISFVSSGYYDKGRLYGPPEDCYPPEGDDERLLDGLVSIVNNRTGKVINLTKAMSEELFSLYEDEIMDKELDFTSYEYDYESDYLIKDNK